MSGLLRHASSCDRVAKDESRTVLQWVAAALGTLIVGGTVAYFAWLAVLGDQQPAQLVARADSVSEHDSGMLVHFSVRNTGDLAAAQVTVVMVDGGGEVVASVLFEHVPGGSVRSGATMLPAGSAGPPSLRISSFRQP